MGRRPLGIADDFRSAAAAAAHAPGTLGGTTIGAQLAWAVTRILPAQGAGISVLGSWRVRVPLGASGPDAAAAERWQFTTGQGPCVDAFAARRPVLASETAIARTWPGLFSHLRQHTPYRSVLGAPLPGGGALVLYFPDPDGCAAMDLDDIAVVSREISNALVERDLQDAGTWPGSEPPAARRHTRVWVAVGMVAVALDLDAADALDVLRARAQSDDRTAEDLAVDIVAGTMHPGQLD